jgi:glyceraldehyde-3-phosphate dehydrogenase (NAD(P))
MTSPMSLPLLRSERHIRVGIVGAGTIGKRLVDAVSAQPDMVLTGVGIRHSGPFCDARRETVPFYRSSEAGDFGDLPTCGGLGALLDASDIIADCGPGGSARARMALYADSGKPAVLQGGEDVDIAEVSHCSARGAERLPGARNARVVSCNTTALVRFISALEPLSNISRVRLVLVRCAADPDKAAKGHVCAMTADRGQSHHADDLRLFWPHLDVASIGLKAPTNRGHMISGFLEFAEAPSIGDIHAALSRACRIRLVDGPPSTAMIRPGLGRGPRMDYHELIVWEPCLVISGRELRFSLSVHMESVVIPDTIDALRLMARPARPVAEVCALTDAALRGEGNVALQSEGEPVC